MSIRKLSLLLLVLVFQIFVSGCSKSRDGGPVPVQPNPVAPTFTSTYRITGTVLGINGNPVENAKVSILTTTNATFTDVNGKYSFENVNIGAYTLACEKAGFTYSEIKSVVTENGSSTPDLILKDVTKIAGRQETETTGSAIKTSGLSVVSTTTEQVSTGTGSVATEKKEVKVSIPSNTEITIDNKVVNAAVTVSAAPLLVSDMPPAPKNEMTMGAAVFEPQGATFSQPVSITVPMTIPLPAGLQLPVKKYENGQYVTVGTATINAAGTGADAKVSQFGQLTIQPKINVNLTPDPKPQEVSAPPISVPAGQTSYVAQTTDAVKFPSGLPKGVSVEYATSLIEKMKNTKIGFSKNVVIQAPNSQIKAAKIAKVAGVEEVVETEFTVVKKTVTNSETITITIDTANLTAKRAEVISLTITYEYITETYVTETNNTVKYEVHVTLTGASGVSVTMSEKKPNGSTGTSTTLSNITENTVFTFLGLKNTNYTVEAFKEGYNFEPPSRATGNLIGDVSFDIKAKKKDTTFLISGTVTGADSVTVDLSGRSKDSQLVTIKNGGSFAFSVDSNDDPNKGYTITPSKVGFTFVPVNRSWGVLTSSPTLTTFTATRTSANITCTVNGANGVILTLKGGPTGTNDKTSTPVGGGKFYVFEGVQTGYSYTVSGSKGSGPTGTDPWIITPAITPAFILTGDVAYVFEAKQGQDLPTITASVDGADGVTVTLMAGTTIIGTPQTVNDKKSYSWSSLVQGTYTVTAVKAGVTFDNGGSVTFTNLKANAEVLFKAINNVTVSGTLKKPGDSGAPIEGATLTLSSVGQPNQTTTSGPSGSYSFSVRTDKEYTITPSLAGYVFTPSSINKLYVKTSNVTGQDFVGKQYFTLSGTVVGLAGVTVAYTGVNGNGSQTVNSSGNYTFTNVAAGTYTVTVSRSDVTIINPSKSVTITNSNQTVNFNITMSQHNQGSIQ